MAFQPATRKRVKARLALAGMSKSGKSFTALALLRGIVGPEGRIAAVDTENGALSLYAGKFPGTTQPSGFDVENLTNCGPDQYIKAINEAVRGRYDGLLIDSSTQEWAAILELVDGNTDKFFGGWKAATPKHNDFIRAIVTAPLHVIVTIRQKDEYVIEKDANGKNAPRKVGTEMIQRKQFEYEFNAVMTMDLEHNIRVTHSAIDFMPNGTLIAPSTDPNDIVVLGEHVRKWLDDGTEDWVPPTFRKSFYVNDREVISGGVTREQYVAIMNAGVALDKVTKRGYSMAKVKELTEKVPADLTEDEATKVLLALKDELTEKQEAKS